MLTELSPPSKIMQTFPALQVMICKKPSFNIKTHISVLETSFGQLMIYDDCSRTTPQINCECIQKRDALHLQAGIVQHRTQS